MSSPALSVQGRLYVLVVVALGGAAISHSLGSLWPHPPPGGYAWMLLAALTFFSGPFTIKVPSVHTTISVSESFVFASALLFGPEAAVITVALDGLIVSLWSRQPSLYRTLFNIAEPAVSVWVAAQLFYYLADVPPLYQSNGPLLKLLLPLLALTTVYFLLNSVIISIAIYFERGVTPINFLRNHLPQLSLNFFSSMSLAVLVLTVQGTGDVRLAAAGVILPLLVMSYISSKTSVARFEDANRHLAELNRLYLSTVETLAMAIDAKDQITHGHIRRVQVQAVALARELGVQDEKEIKAIEAAALLHDLGKLAVPEHILNKPGKLTPAEFEQMKQHASIGADILSRINFPYPVTPIVRHHHENWDGTGYPDRIVGETIPLGARILSVVDCFDALTSDRPYRRALSNKEAIDVLMERRGNMYDPTVVDGFIQLHARMPREAFASHVSRNELSKMVSTTAPAPAPSAEPAPPEETDPIAIEGVRLSAALRLLGDGMVCVLYRYEPSSDSLLATFVSSPAHAAVKGMRIPLGEKLSGWVAANRRAIFNSDPALDLGEDLAVASGTRLGSCLCVPLEADGTLLGALTLYAIQMQAFTEDHVALVKLVSSEIARRLQQSAAPPTVDAQQGRARPRLVAGAHGSESSPPAGQSRERKAG